MYVKFSAKNHRFNEKNSKFAKKSQIFHKNAIFDENFEIRERCKGVHCVDLGESFPTSSHFGSSGLKRHARGGAARRWLGETSNK